MRCAVAKEGHPSGIELGRGHLPVNDFGPNVVVAAGVSPMLPLLTEAIHDDPQGAVRKRGVVDRGPDRGTAKRVRNLEVRVVRVPARPCAIVRRLPEQLVFLQQYRAADECFDSGLDPRVESQHAEQAGVGDDGVELKVDSFVGVGRPVAQRGDVTDQAGTHQAGGLRLHGPNSRLVPEVGDEKVPVLAPILHLVRR